MQYQFCYDCYHRGYNNCVCKFQQYQMDALRQYANSMRNIGVPSDKNNKKQKRKKLLLTIGEML